MARKTIKTGQRPAIDHLCVQLIPTIVDEVSAIETKKAAQKLLSMMFSSLHKRGRPKKETSEELAYAA